MIKLDNKSHSMNKNSKRKRVVNKQDELREKDSIYMTSIEQENGMAVTISSYKEQEEANFRYWLQMSPAERLDLNHKMMLQLFSDKIEENKRRKSFTIVIEKA